MTTHYLVPCTACGQKVRVEFGQAGAQVLCGCGQTLIVPSARGMRQLESETEREPATPRKTWNPLRGAIFSAGLFVTVCAALYAGWQGVMYVATTPREDPWKNVAMHEEMHISSLTLEQSFDEFRIQEKEGLGEPQPPIWLEVEKMNRASARRAIIGLCVAGLGLVASAASMIGSRKRSPPKR